MARVEQKALSGERGTGIRVILEVESENRLTDEAYGLLFADRRGQPSSHETLEPTSASIIGERLTENCFVQTVLVKITCEARVATLNEYVERVQEAAADPTKVITLMTMPYGA